MKIIMKTLINQKKKAILKIMMYLHHLL